MKIGTLLGLAIAVALVVLVMRWLRGRAARQAGTVSRDKVTGSGAIGYDGTPTGSSKDGNRADNDSSDAGGGDGGD